MSRKQHRGSSRAVDAYIARAPEFARPILVRVRSVFHAACPDLVETIKWGAPHFERHGLIAGMTAFKRHVSLSFWRGKRLEDPHGLFRQVGDSSMCALKLEKASDLPSARILREYVMAAVRLDEELASTARDGRTRKSKAPPRKAPLRPPAYFMAALRENPEALDTYKKLSPGRRREYLEWITDAKQEATRKRRLAAAIEWMAEGKERNWKYRKTRSGERPT